MNQPATRFFNLKIIKPLLVLLYCIVALVICRYAKKNSYYDLDIVMYTACAISGNNASPAEIHKQAYAMAKKDLGEEKFAQLTDSTKYFRNSVYKNAANFYSQLPFYTVKPLYVAVLSVAYKLGFSPILFSTYINIFCYLAIAAILLLYLTRISGFYKAYAASFCIMLLPVLLDTLKSNTPDMPAALLILAATLLLLSEKQSFRNMAVVVCCLLIFTRPENILFVAAFSAVCFRTRLPEYPKKYLGFLFLSSCACYLVVTLMFKSYPWPLLYKHSFLGYIPDLQNADPSLTIKEYLLGLRFIPNSVFYSDFFLMIFLLVFPLFYMQGKKNIQAVMIFSLLACIALRIVLFPDLATRFYTGFFILSFVLFYRQFFGRPAPQLPIN